MDPVPESVSKSIVTSCDLSPKIFQLSLLRASSLSSGFIIGKGSTDLILKGSMIVLNSMFKL